MTCGEISDSANSRTLRRSCCCSSVKEKSTGPQVNYVSNTAHFLYTTGMWRAFLRGLRDVPKTQGLSSTGFSLWGLVLAGSRLLATKTHRLKPVLLNSNPHYAPRFAHRATSSAA